MSIYFSGTHTRSGGILSAITKQLKLVNLKPVKKIEVQFDPFQVNAKTARDFLHAINNKKVVETNLNCIIKANVLADRSEPSINISLLDSSYIQLKANNLTVLDLLQLINKHISSKVEPEEAITTFKLQKVKKK